MIAKIGLCCILYIIERAPASLEWRNVLCSIDILWMAYLHDNDEGQFGCQDVPELHSVGVLPLVAWRVAVVTVPRGQGTGVVINTHIPLLMGWWLAVVTVHTKKIHTH